MLRIVRTSQFKKDYKKISNNKKLCRELFLVIEKLAHGKKLDKKNKDHQLKGKLRSMRECHVLPDFLLIYEVVDDELILVLSRAGSHSGLF